MSGTPVTVPLQMMCQFLAAGLLVQNMTVQLIPRQAVVETNNSQVLPSGYVAFPEFGVAYKRSTIQLYYTKASQSCLEEGGQLAVINSREKIDKIINHFAANPGWVGLGMGGFHGTSSTSIDGESTNNLSWLSGRSNGAAYCPFLSKSSSGILRFGCGHALNYLCEIALPKN